MLFMIVMVFYPLVVLMRNSFTTWDGLNPATFNGIKNYVRLFKDPLFYTGLKNGIIPMIGSLIEVLMRICAPVILSSIIGYISICVAGPAAWTASMLLMLAVYYIKMKGFKNKKALA